MLIIKDLTMGRSWSFVRVKSGYAQAYAKIQEIIAMGHKVGGDISDVTKVMGSL